MWGAQNYVTCCSAVHAVYASSLKCRDVRCISYSGASHFQAECVKQELHHPSREHIRNRQSSFSSGSEITACASEIIAVYNPRGYGNDGNIAQEGKSGPPYLPWLIVVRLCMPYAGCLPRNNNNVHDSRPSSSATNVCAEEGLCGPRSREHRPMFATEKMTFVACVVAFKEMWIF